MIVRFIFFLLFTGTLWSKTFTVSGHVADATTKETIIGVNVLVQDENNGAATDNEGFFRITGLAPGHYMLRLTHIAYEMKVVEVTVSDRSLMLEDLLMKPKAVEMREVVVRGTRSEVADIEMEISHREITPQTIRAIPSSYDDLFRAIKFLPGVEGVDPISPLYAVRGGDPGENMILLDGVTIYNPYHCVSSSSLFNLYAVKNVEMMVGGFGAEYGGRNSSVMYITTREGSSEGLHGEVEPGLMSSKAVLDFPVGRNATMMVSGRFYYDLVNQYLMYSPSYFYDFNAAIAWKINSRNRLSLRYLHSKDYMDLSMNRFMGYFDATLDMDVFENYHLTYNNRWRNQAVTAILKSVLSPSIYLKTQVSGSFFSAVNRFLMDFEYADDDSGDRFKLFYQTDIDNRIRDVSGRMTLNITLHPTNTIHVGGELNAYYFSNDFLINQFSEGAAVREPRLFAFFAEDKVTLGPIMLRAGLRLSHFGSEGRWRREPRLNAALRLPWGMTLKGAWGEYTQYIISINSQEYELSQFLDYYYPLTEQEPSESRHAIVGLEKRIRDRLLLSIDAYHKDISRTYTFDYNLSESEAFRFTDKLVAGTGESYGVEILAKGTWNRFSGWLSYGISRSTRSYPHIMDGESFLYDYDRTHAFKVVIHHQVHPSLSYSGTLRMLSGVPKTMETAIKSYYYYDPVTNAISSYPTYVSNRKNNVRFPMFIRLDLGLKKRIRKGFGAELARFFGADESYLNVAFSNLLFFHRNVMFYLHMGEDKPYGLGTNYFPMVNVGYTIKF